MEKTTALVLAAGKGTRMRSRLAKVLHPLCGRPMVGWVLEACREAALTPVVVVGHQADAVRAALPGVHTVLQAEQRGTGHAVQCAVGAIPTEGTLVVLAGDTPRLRGETLAALVERHRKSGALCTVLTMPCSPDTAYGRIVRAESGAVLRIVEAANATAEELAITEANSGTYAFDARWLIEDVLPRLQPHPPKDELYLTDAIEAAAGRLEAHLHEDAGELAGVNDKNALEEAQQALQARINHDWRARGATVREPAFIDATVELAQDVTVEPGVVLRSGTVVGEGSTIYANSVLEGARVGRDCKVGPFARLREGTVLDEGVKVGNFVETKKAHLHEGVKAGHLAYLGDAEIGAETNIGAGTITCNYDGYAKHKTTIGERVFVGTNASLVAPLEVGDDALIGAGSTITQDVPAEGLALGRGRQKTFAGRGKAIKKHLKDKAGK